MTPYSYYPILHFYDEHEDLSCCFYPVLRYSAPSDATARTVARLRRERRCCAASGVFSACSPFYTLRHDNFLRYSFTWLAINLRENENPANPVTQVLPRRPPAFPTELTRSVSWSLHHQKMTTPRRLSFEVQ